MQNDASRDPVSIVEGIVIKINMKTQQEAINEGNIVKPDMLKSQLVKDERGEHFVLS